MTTTLAQNIIGQRIMEITNHISVQNSARHEVYGYRMMITRDIDRNELKLDVLAHLREIMLKDWDAKYAEKTLINQRKFACGTVRNLARQAIDELARERDKLASVEVLGATDAATRLTGYEAEFDLLHQHLAEIPGMDVAELMRKARLSPNLRDNYKHALTALKAGTKPNLADIASHVLTIPRWAEARWHQGNNLSTIDAVTHGATYSHGQAHIELTDWYVTHSPIHTHCPSGLLVAGLLDHIQPARRLTAAKNVALRLADNGIPASTTCTMECLHTHHAQLMAVAA